jgi:Rrf2 family protein
MPLRKSTRHALYAALEMARAGAAAPVKVICVAERYAIGEAALAKVFQRLARAGVAVSSRGVKGGYQLARRPSQLTVLDIVEALEPRRCETACAEDGACRLRRLFDEVDDTVRCAYAAVTLETLVDRTGGRRAETRE